MLDVVRRGGDGPVHASLGYLGQGDGGMRAAVRVEDLVQQSSMPIIDARGWGGCPLVQAVGRGEVHCKPVDYPDGDQRQQNGSGQ